MLPRPGRPQFFAFLLLLAFLGQSLWVIHRRPLLRAEAAYAQAGLDQLEGKLQPRDMGALPVPATLVAAPVVLAGRVVRRMPAETLRWVLRLPFVVVGWLLGASLWHVARRLYGNPGGYIALALYCSSPEVVRHAARVSPETAAAWGFFGIVFTGIAVAHTLYAPPAEAWREARPRLGLLGLAVGVGVGASFSAVIGIPLALAFMLYLVPGRRRRALLMLATSCFLGLLLLWAAYFLSARALAQGLADAYLSHFFPAPNPGWLARADEVGVALLDALTLPGSLLLAVALGTYLGWQRARYFGNTAPLLTGVLLVAWMLVQPRYLTPEIVPWVLPFFFVFVAGICTDLLELRRNQALGSKP